eukprot:Gb_41495 [translate_table: standard]
MQGSLILVSDGGRILQLNFKEEKLEPFDCVNINNPFAGQSLGIQAEGQEMTIDAGHKGSSASGIYVLQAFQGCNNRQFPTHDDENEASIWLYSLRRLLQAVMWAFTRLCIVPSSVLNTS